MRSAFGRSEAHFHLGSGINAFSMFERVYACSYTSSKAIIINSVKRPKNVSCTIFVQWIMPIFSTLNHQQINRCIAHILCIRILLHFISFYFVFLLYFKRPNQLVKCLCCNRLPAICSTSCEISFWIYKPKEKWSRWKVSKNCLLIFCLFVCL